MNRKKIGIFIACYFAYVSIYIARLNLSIASPEMISRSIINTTQIGFLGSFFSVIYACGRLINGAIGERKPSWLMISTGMIVAGISNILIGFFPPFIGMLLLWGANAYAQSMLWSSILCIISEIYDEKEAKKKMSYMVSSVAVGNIIGIVLNTILVEKLGAAYAFIIPGGLTLILSTAVILSTFSIKHDATKAQNHIQFRNIIKNNELKIAILPAMFHGLIRDNVSLWMVVYFIDKFAINLNQSAYFVLFIPLVGFVGRIIYPTFYKLCREKEHFVSFLAFLICIIATLPLCMSINSSFVAAICLSVIYASVSVVNTSFLSIFPIRFADTGNVASVSGILDFATYCGAGIGSFIYGFIIAKFGYSTMFFSWTLLSVLSAFIVRLLMKKQEEKIKSIAKHK